jgi:hypothetical protein
MRLFDLGPKWASRSTRYREPIHARRQQGCRARQQSQDTMPTIVVAQSVKPADKGIVFSGLTIVFCRLNGS